MRALLVVTLLFPALAAAAPGSLRFHGNGTPPVVDPVQQITPPPVDRVEIRIDAPAVPADLGAEDFTLEFWMRADPGDNNAGPCAPGVGGWRRGNLIFDRNVAGDGDYGEYGVTLFQDGIGFGVGVGAAGNTICGKTDVDAVPGIWHHVAVTRRQSTGELVLFVDGKLDASGPGPAGDASYRDDRPTGQDAIDPYLFIGGRKLANQGDLPAFNGFIDEVRLSNSIRYTGDFVPPTAPFEPDASTAALYHFDDAPPGDCIGVVLDSVTIPGKAPSHGTCRFGGNPPGPSYSSETPPQLVPCTGDACVRCGNGVVEPENDEQCDLGGLNGADQLGNSCCDGACRLRPAGFACRTSASICERPAQCSGDRADCPANPAEPSDKPCADGNACTTEDHCSGTGLCVGGVDVVCSIEPAPSLVTLPAAANKAFRALARKRSVTLGCASTAVRDGTGCLVEGIVSAAQLGTVAARASDGEVGVPAACDPFRVAADRDEYRVCQSKRRALKQAGSPVPVKCRPTQCLKAHLKLKRSKTLTVDLFAVYEGVGLGSEGELAGRISAGQVELRQRE